MKLFLVKIDDLWWDDDAHTTHGGEIDNLAILSHTRIEYIRSPILVENIPGPNNTKFKVRNGRHRILAAVYMHRTHILARFIEDSDGEVQAPE